MDVTGQMTLEAMVNNLDLRRTNLAAGVVKLFQASFDPDENSVVADFAAAEADFTGYAAVTLGTWSTIGVSAEGEVVALATRAFFQATDAVAPNVIGGYWLETAGGDMDHFVRFDPPVLLTTALSFLAVTISITTPGVGGADIES